MKKKATAERHTKERKNKRSGKSLKSLVFIKRFFLFLLHLAQCSELHQFVVFGSDMPSTLTTFKIIYTRQEEKKTAVELICTLQ